MFIELIDALRCVTDHPQIPLVAAITGRDGRYVTDGTLGCPTCRREYPIVQGIAWFGIEPEIAAEFSANVDTNTNRDDEAVMRIGAFLSAPEGATVALVGDWAIHAAKVSDLANLRVFAVNPPESVEQSERAGVVRSMHELPFANGSLAGVAINNSTDDDPWSPDELARAAHKLAPGARMVAPASWHVPSGVEEIARDDTIWIGEKRAPLVTLHRR
jgi:uncharacterized protein YbaR (Trm112 family)